MDNRPIGMFDSGLGGLTVFAEVKKKIPKEQIIYLGDTKRFPYGSKSKEAIINISRQCVEFLIKKNVKAIIIACGTATSQSIDVLQKEYDIPIIGIIQPTITDLKEKGINGKVGVLATKGTIRSDAWKTKLVEQIKDAQVVNVPAPILAPLAESGWIRNQVAEAAIHEYMKPLKEVKHLILGCTHYPLFTPLIQKELGKQVEIINTGEKLANYLEKILRKHNLQAEEKKEKNKLYLTDIEETFVETAKLFLPNEDILKTIEKIDF